MRSLYTALALCAVTLVMSSGASPLAGQTFCDECAQSHRPGLLQGKCRCKTCQAGCDRCAAGDTTCATCNECGEIPMTTWNAPVSECGCGEPGCDGACQQAPVNGCCSSCGKNCGGRCGMKSRSTGPLMGRSRIFGANQSQGCGGTGCGGCPDCGAAPAGMSGLYTGGLEACSVCGKPDCKGCGRSRSPIIGGRSSFGTGMSSADNSCGCGKSGCGEGGQQCLRCRLKNGLGTRPNQTGGGDCGYDTSVCQTCDSDSCGNGGRAGLGLGGSDRLGSRNHPFVDALRAKGCETPGCQPGGQFGSGYGVTDRGVGFGGVQRGCGVAGCGTNGQLCSNCLNNGGYGGASGHDGGYGGGSGYGGMQGGCGAPGCGVGGQLCSNCLSRLYGGHLHQKAAHLLPAIHPYGGAIPHTELQPGMGGQAPTYAYPYYTTRGPRDFLQDACAPGPILPYNPRTSCLPPLGY